MLEKAKQLIQDNVCSVAAVTPDGEGFTDNGSTVRPLFLLYEAHNDQLRGAAVADKIIGRAAASLLCSAGVGEAFAFLMSETGLALLQQYGIKASYGELTPAILNRTETGLCPMERAVDGVDDLDQCVRNIAEFVATVPQPSFD